jgi:hypothetical protein
MVPGDQTLAGQPYQRSGPTECYNTKLVLIGSIVGLRESLVLLSQQAYTGLVEKQWPDLTQFECFACHVELQADKRRA